MRTGFRLALATFPVGFALFLPSAAHAWPWPRPDAGDPFTMSVDDVACGTGRVAVRLHNQSRQPVYYSLKADSSSVSSGAIPARDTIVKHVPVHKGSNAEIEAYHVTDKQPEALIDSTIVDNDCPWGHRTGHLPFTGPPTDLMAKLATAGGLVVMGGILWWYGSIWPRRLP
ncbi:hypothetical protein [Nonomuraea jiangxiensis]|uniref:Uncharacterized protein n=1 Tax=Nonomuraea jiangxiensis TaxID=633440 RepID=A0A1G8V7W6_9ACTN|nr:hypothetical protein [Nonomuraea jiangxiensis]SDJ62103.1 hypothetical protein SAMN05421869_111226 [Nonomuraea jiangxiensis]